MKMRNVHEFDGKIPMRMNCRNAEQDTKKILDDAEFLKKMRLDAQIMANQILTENSDKNVDRLNHEMDAKQLFLALLEKISKIPDRNDQQMFHQLLEEQLCDMKNLGPCPQGRTIRLWQLWQSLE